MAFIIDQIIMNDISFNTYKDLKSTDWIIRLSYNAYDDILTHKRAVREEQHPASRYKGRHDGADGEHESSQ